jgi:hypothetical protein
MRTSIVPSDTERTVYQVLDDIGEYGHVWREIGDTEANEQTVVEWIAEGECEHPVRVVAFNTDEGWSRDVTSEVALKLLDLSRQGRALGAGAREFVERGTGQAATVIV